MTPYILRSKSLVHNFQFHTSQVREHFSRLHCYDLVSSADGDMCFIIALLAVTGCRISEILRLKVCHFQRSGFLFIPASKGSSDRSFHLPVIVAAVLDTRPACLPTRAAFQLSYNSVYHFVVSHLPGHLMQKHGERRAVTMYFRRAYVQYVASLGLSINVSDVIGHKEANNTNFYLGGL
jgi:integrase